MDRFGRERGRREMPRRSSPEEDFPYWDEDPDPYLEEYEYAGEEEEEEERKGGIWDPGSALPVLLYLAASAGLSLFLYRLFVPVLFYPIRSPFSDAPLTRGQSLAVLHILMAVLSLGGALATCRNHRSVLSLLLNTAAPFGVFLVLEMLPHPPFLVKVMLVLILLCILFSLVMHFIRPLRLDSRFFQHLLRRIAGTARSIQLTAGTLLAVFCAVCLAGAAAGFPLVQAYSPRESTGDRAMEADPSAHAGELAVLNRELWQTLTMEQKTAALQTVADIEAASLGLPWSLTVSGADLPDSTAAEYLHASLSVFVDTDYLEQAGSIKCVSAVLHECYHGYEYALCSIYSSVDEEFRDLAGIRDARDYISEFSNYIGGEVDGDLTQYSEQRVEQDARAYADERIRAYEPFLFSAAAPASSQPLT